eukprot:7273206-Prymnesium_polylepis.1
MKLVNRRSGGLMEMSGLHEPDSSQRSQLRPSPMSRYTIAPRPSEAMPLAYRWLEKECPPPDMTMTRPQSDVITC